MGPMPEALSHFSCEADLHEQHIERCAGEQAQKHSPFPLLQCGGHSDGDELRQRVVRIFVLRRLYRLKHILLLQLITSAN